MRRWTWARRAVAVAVVVGSGTALSGCTPAQPTPITSRWETAAPNQDYARDGGYSAPLPDLPGFAGKSMWLWGDTVTAGVSIPNTGTFASISDSTSNPVPGVAEIPAPDLYPDDSDNNIDPASTGPTVDFLPTPEGLRLPNGTTACGFSDGPSITASHPVTWPLGLARGPGGGAQIVLNGTTYTAAHLMFITYVDMCLLSHPAGSNPDISFVGQRVGLAVYNPVNNQIVTRVPLFGASPNGSNLPWQQVLFHPTFVGSDVYFYAVCNPDLVYYDICPDTLGKVGQARVPLSQVLNGTQYQWKTATGWSSNPADVSSIVPVDSTHQPWSVYVGDYGNVGRGWIMVVGTSGDGDVSIYQGPSANGPWTMRLEGKMFGCPEYADPTLLKCYHLWGHPELSTTEDLIFSYHAQHPNGGDVETYLVSLGDAIPPL